MIPQKQVSFIPNELFIASLDNYEQNNFVKYLIGLFDIEITNNLLKKYFIGTSKYWDGANIFWQIDIHNKIRTGKIMLYNTIGHRVKKPFNHINWVHKLIQQPDFELKQCLFGEHLLKGNMKPVAIVESEKTAVIASVYLPQFIWLAVGSLNNLNAEKCKVLQGRTVVLYPDLNGFEKWNEKKKELARLFPGTQFNISDLLERKATEIERLQGLDLADYLIRFDYKAFQKHEQPEPQKRVLLKEITVTIPEKQTNNNIKNSSISNFKSSYYKDNWYSFNKKDKINKWNIEKIELFFQKAKLPPNPIKLNDFEIIVDVKKFIESSLATCKANNGNETFLPYWENLLEFQKYLIN